MRMPPEFSYALPVPDWLFREGMYLTHVGWERVEPGERYPHPATSLYIFEWGEGRVLPEYCLAWCIEGRGELETHKGHAEIKAGEGFFYQPGEWHRHRPLVQSGWKICWIHYNGSLPHEGEKQKSFLLQGNKPLIAEPELFAAQFQRLLHGVYGKPGCNSVELSYQAIGLLSHFFVDVRSQDNNSSSARLNRVWRARDFIMNHTHTSISVGDVAAHVGCNRRTLEIQFKQTEGRTVLDEIQHCRVERARSLLAETDLPIKQVVHRSGFQSREQMRLVFRKLLGITPSDVRR